MRMILAALVATGLGGAALAEVATPDGRVLVTVAGDLPESNRPAAKPDDANFLGYLDLEFEKAIAFDDGMLSDLSQHQITANLLDTGKDITYSGPRLSDLLKASGAEGKTAMPMAFDGYQAEIAWDLIQEHEPILATHADGKPLAIGGLGPAMVVFPVVDDKELYETFTAMEVYATFFIAVE